MFNANLDRNPDVRKSSKELQRELATWEDQKARGKDKKAKNVVEDLDAYEVGSACPVALLF
jgi:ribonuclease D